MRWMLLFATAVAVAVVAAGGTGPRAQTQTDEPGAPLPAVAPRLQCADLAREDFTRVPDATTSILGAAVVTPDQGNPYCQVRGYVAPQVQFELRLPAQGWTQRYLQLGCGGYCGSIGFNYDAADGCLPVERGEFAVAATNQGHVGSSGFDGVWGSNDPQLRIDEGHRAVHVVAVASKAIIERYYGQAPRYSYHAGCSAGGHAGLMEAQRYPDDFDGIVAGAPANNWVALNSMLQGWMALVNRGPLIGPEQAASLAKAAMDECDGRDGLVDGQIDDPRACRFDPGVLEGSLTPEQIRAARKIYSGPGRDLYPAGRPVGSEDGWPAWTTIADQAALNFLRFLAYRRNPPPDYSLAEDLRFDASELRRLQRQASPIYDATDPDLDAFRHSGGKLILWHGWSDPAIPPVGTVAYYDAVRKTVGASRTDAFLKLYMLPGVAHCSGGVGPDRIDFLSRVMDWVETDRAPDRVVASKVVDGKVTRTRPVFPYPVVARYAGSGSIDDEASFRPFTPPRAGG
jgi:hypothetical protein